MNKLFSLILILITAGTLHAAESERFITKVKLPSEQTAVVAERVVLGNWHPYRV